MLYRSEDKFKLMPLLATYNQHGETHEQYAIKRKELQNFEEMGHITNLTFEEVVYEKDVLDRLSEVEDYPESEFQTVQRYVIDNEVVEGTSLVLKKQNEIIEESLLELSMMFMTLGGM